MTDLPTESDLPSSLVERDQWVCWQSEERDGKLTKVPINPTSGRYASTTDPNTWASFERAREYASMTDVIEGIGFVFTDDDPLVGVDLDDCRDTETEESADWATDVIDRLDSYTEISPSGTGYHVIVRGTLPEGRNRKGDIECYETARYFTVTGNRIPATSQEIAEQTDELAAVTADYLTDQDGDKDETVDHAERSEITLPDEDLLEKAKQAVNGERFTQLWNGSTAGYESHSEADMALCCHLAFWTGGHEQQIDRLFRRSGLMREKWDEIHFADGSTYGEKTIERAVNRVDDYYDPDSERDTSPSIAAVTGTERESFETEQQTAEAERRRERLRETIARLDARVQELEAENEQLREELRQVREISDERESKQQSDQSLLKQVKRMLGVSKSDTSQ